MPAATFNLPTWIAGLPIVFQLVFYIGILATIAVMPLIVWFAWAFRPTDKAVDAGARPGSTEQPDQISPS